MSLRMSLMELSMLVTCAVRACGPSVVRHGVGEESMSLEESLSVSLRFLLAIVLLVDGLGLFDEGFGRGVFGWCIVKDGNDMFFVSAALLCLLIFIKIRC